MPELEQVCIQKIAEAKAIPVDLVTLDTPLEQLAIDSLDLVSLSFDLEEKYGVEIPERELHQLKTVRDVAAAIRNAMEKKQSAADPAAGNA